MKMMRILDVTIKNRILELTVKNEQGEKENFYYCGPFSFEELKALKDETINFCKNGEVLYG